MQAQYVKRDDFERAKYVMESLHNKNFKQQTAPIKEPQSGGMYSHGC